MLLLLIEFIYYQIKHFSLECSFFQATYDYKSIFDIHIENDAIKEKVSVAKKKVSVAKKHIKQLQNMQNTLTQ